MKSGDVCEQCRCARLAAISSRAVGEFQVRYLRCPSCGATGRSVVKADLIRRRGTEGESVAQGGRESRHFSA